MTDQELNEAETAAGLPTTVNYRYADRVGDELFVAGQVPHDADGIIATPNQPGIQASVCLDNLFALVGVHGFSVTDIRHLTVYVVGDRAALAEAWRTVEERFERSVPPATLLGVAVLGHEEQLVEIDARVRRLPPDPLPDPAT